MDGEILLRHHLTHASMERALNNDDDDDDDDDDEVLSQVAEVKYLECQSSPFDVCNYMHTRQHKLHQFDA